MGEIFENFKKKLLGAGIDVKVRNKYGDTAIMIVKEKGHTPIVNLLRKAGAKEY
jgi:ankyrin repeat protein